MDLNEFISIYLCTFNIIKNRKHNKMSVKNENTTELKRQNFDAGNNVDNMNILWL